MSIEQASRIRAAMQDQADSRKRRLENEHVVWILGAGFSRSLGGPLFAELLDPSVANWVSAWTSSRNLKSPSPLSLTDAVTTYDIGLRNRLWTNPEDYLSFLDSMRTDSMSQFAFGTVFGSDKPSHAAHYWARASQFFAIATSYFVDRVRKSQLLPDAWVPYLNWMRSLGSNDSILTFNYDRVVEEVMKRTEITPRSFIKLHGDVPDPDELATLVCQGSPVDTISTPGLKKVDARHGHLAERWQEAAAVLKSADRLIVVGYSFPAADASATELVLRNWTAKRATIVLGRDQAGNHVTRMFGRLLSSHRTNNTGLLAEQFLMEGSALTQDGRFNHGA